VAFWNFLEQMMNPKAAGAGCLIKVIFNNKYLLNMENKCMAPACGLTAAALASSCKPKKVQKLLFLATGCFPEVYG